MRRHGHHCPHDQQSKAHRPPESPPVATISFHEPFHGGRLREAARPTSTAMVAPTPVTFAPIHSSYEPGVAADSDPFAPFAFQLAASELLGAEVALFSDEVLRNEHVSADLLAASPL